MSLKKPSKAPTVTSELNENFFKLFKHALPAGHGLAEELSDILGVSLDSTYRRIRGETNITLEEISIITKKYPFSIDEVLGQRNNTATFSYTKLTDNEDNFINYMARLQTQLTVINQFPNKKIYYVADEAPLFYSFGSRKLTEFKLFFWQRSVLNIEKYQHEKFRWGIVPQHLIDIATNSHKEYLSIPCTEIWTDETVLTNLKQVKFYYDSGLLDKSDALDLLNEHRHLISNVKTMAENGRKNISDKDETFVMYSSDVVLGTNCIYVQMADRKYAYLSFNSINSITTSNAEFCEETESWLRNLEKKSTLISGVGEKQRYQFFSKMFKTIDDCINTISQ